MVGAGREIEHPLHGDADGNYEVNVILPCSQEGQCRVTVSDESGSLAQAAFDYEALAGPVERIPVPHGGSCVIPGGSNIRWSVPPPRSVPVVADVERGAGQLRRGAPDAGHLHPADPEPLEPTRLPNRHKSGV